MTRRAHLAAALCLFTAGCACGPAPTPDAGVDPNAVTGDFLERFLLADGGLLVAPVRLDQLTLGAEVEADGGVLVLAGVGKADGTFVIPNVPQGPWTLVVGDIVIHTRERVLHLGSNNLGRHNVFQANPNEGLRLTVDNLAPWGDDDELQLVSWNAGIGFFSTSRRATACSEGQPDAGDVALVGCGLDLEGEPVVEAKKGDDLLLLQVASTKLDGGTLKRAVRALPITTDLSLGKLTDVAGTFTTLPLTPDTLSMKGDEFTRHAQAVHPTATAYELALLIEAHPGPFGRTSVTGSVPDLAVARFPAGAGDIALAVEVANPFAAPWTTFRAGGALFDVQYAAAFPDGGLAPARSEAGFVSFNVLRSDVGPHVPLISPPLDVRLDGQSATAELTDVAPSPMVSWAAPQVGTVSRVDIDIVELTPNINVTRRQLITTVRVVTDTTSVRLPPGILNPGRTYFLRVTALSLPPEYRRDEPRLDVGPPAGAASAMTSAFRVRAQ